MDDGFGPTTREDIRLEAHLKLTTGDGTELVVIDEDRLLRGVLLKCDPDGADGRLAGHFTGLIVSPIRARLGEYVERFRLTQPANEYFARIDEFFPRRGYIDWFDEPPGKMPPEMAHRIEQALMNRHNHQLEVE